MSISAIAKALRVGWELINSTAAEAARKLLYTDPYHFDGIRGLGHHEHKWKHNRNRGEPKVFVTVLMDLALVIDGCGPAGLVDIRPGRSAKVLRCCLADYWQKYRSYHDSGGFTGYASADEETIPRRVR